MPALTTARKLGIAGRTIKNMIIGKPLSVSYELTFNCNANCKHCNWGEPVDEPRLEPEVWADLVESIGSAVVQISGGEPLLRNDLCDIISAIRKRDPLPAIVLTSNVMLMTEEKYNALREAGVDKFSFSLDFPDERHDEFRQLKGCFEHISELVPRLARQGNNDIVMACVAQSENFRELPVIAALAAKWGVCVNFSIYTHLRTGKEELSISPGELDDLQLIVDELVEMQKQGYPIITSEYSLRKMIDFYRTRSQPDCKAGKRFFIVNPWGKLAPCGIIQGRFDSQKELLKEFGNTNTCDMCYTAIRANSEKSAYRMLVDALRIIKVKPIQM